jgi:enoyl-CoA hydratase/carnithine racemase
MSDIPIAHIACSQFEVSGRPLSEQLADAIESVIDQDETKAVILELQSDPSDFDVDQFLAQEPLFDRFRVLLRKMELAGKPVVGLIKGSLQGLQLEVALACHARFASTGSFQLGFPGLVYGLMPVLGATQRLPRLAGIPLAGRMLVKGDRITVADAAHWISIGSVDSTIAGWIQAHQQPRQSWDLEAPEASATYSQSTPNRNSLENIYLDLRRRFPPEEAAPTAILRCIQDGLERSIDAGIRLEAEQWVIVKESRSTKNRIKILYRARKRALAERAPVEDLDKARDTDALANALGRIPIVAKGEPFKTRVTVAYVQEALLMLEQGASPWLVDNVALNGGMIIGPLSMADLTGLDQLIELFGAPGSRDKSAEAIRILKEFTNRSRFGKKTNGGIYDYDEEGRQSDWAELSQVFMLSPHQASPEEIEQRLFAVQTIEALHCAKEGIVHDPDIADLASVLGWNYPAGRGGVFSYAHDVDGFSQICAKLQKKFGDRFALP